MTHYLKFKHTFSTFGTLDQLLAHFHRFQQTFFLLAHFLTVSLLLVHFLKLSHLLAYFHNFWNTFSTFGIFSENSVHFPILLQLFTNGLILWHIFGYSKSKSIKHTFCCHETGLILGLLCSRLILDDKLFY